MWGRGGTRGRRGRRGGGGGGDGWECARGDGAADRGAAAADFGGVGATQSAAAGVGEGLEDEGLFSAMPPQTAIVWIAMPLDSNASRMARVPKAVASTAAR